jgi:phosphatidylglycerophosphate synthase
MFDARVRAGLAPYLNAAARPLAARGIPAGAVTAAGFAVGAAACVAAAMAAWPLALVLWLANRVLDGLDGAVARVGGASDRGGFLDIVADFAVYGGFVLGVAVARPEARLACVALLAAYYVSGSALLAWSSLAERRALAAGDDRSLRFVGGLAEGTETVVVYVLLCLFPKAAAPIAWGFAAVVAVTAVQRVTSAARALGRA